MNTINELNSTSLLKSTLLILNYKMKEYKISTDEDGYVAIQDMLKLLRKIHPERKYITAFDLQHIARADIKKRLVVTKDLKRIKLIA